MQDRPDAAGPDCTCEPDSGWSGPRGNSRRPLAAGNPSGSGEVGPTGPQGPAGPTGPQGPARGQQDRQGSEETQGEPGLAGADGATGPRPTGPTGATGPAGPQGDAGPTGTTAPLARRGPAGPGVAAGGSAGQILTSASGVDYATRWAEVFRGLSLPMRPAAGVFIGPATSGGRLARSHRWAGATRLRRSALRLTFRLTKWRSASRPLWPCLWPRS